MSKAKDESPRPERPRGGRARAVSEMLPKVGGAAFRRFGFVQSSIVSRWAEIVGVRYAEASAPESLRFPFGKRADGVLTLTVSGAQAPMIQHILPEITERVNRFFGYAAVAKIILRQGTLPQKPVNKPLLELVAIPKDLGESLKTVADPELKAVLESLARGVATKHASVLGRIS